MRCKVTAIRTELEEVKSSQREGIKPKGTQRQDLPHAKRQGMKSIIIGQFVVAQVTFLETVKRDSRETTGD